MSRLVDLFERRCPITANCPITLSGYSFVDYLVQNTLVNAWITFDEIVIVTINVKLVLSF